MPKIQASPALSRFKVLDLSRVRAGPNCVRILTDFGADVIRIEPPPGVDPNEAMFAANRKGGDFQNINRNKRSMTLNLKRPGAKEVLLRLVREADVVVENFRPGVADRLGIGAAALRAANPALIVASISGFGQQGPAADLPAYDVVVQAMSGWMDATGEEGGTPMRTGEAIGDVAAGLYAAIGILAALLGRSAHGGAHVDIAMMDCLIAMLPTSHALHHYAGQPVTRTGNRHPLSTPFGAFRSADGQVIIAVLGHRQFAGLCALIGQPGLAADPRFASDEARTAHEPVLRALIEGWTTTLTTEALIASLRAAGIPTAPIQTLAQALQSPHAQARGLVADLPHHRLGHSPVAGQPIRFDGQKPLSATGAPALGGDTRPVLTALGLTPDQIAGLIAAGIVQENDLG